MPLVKTLAEAEALRRDGDTWYFAYGSNLNIDQKQKRTGLIRAAIPSRLDGYRFVFGKCNGEGGSFADIVPDAESYVLGVVYLCDEPAMLEFDRCEGVLSGHYRSQIVTVLAGEHAPIEAETYVACDERRVQGRRPKEKYLKLILRGGRDHGLPHDYLAMIERLAVE